MLALPADLICWRLIGLPRLANSPGVGNAVEGGREADVMWTPWAETSARGVCLTPVLGESTAAGVIVEGFADGCATTASSCAAVLFWAGVLAGLTV